MLLLRLADHLSSSFGERCSRSLGLYLAEDRKEAEPQELASTLKFVASQYVSEMPEEEYLAKSEQY